MTALIEIRQDSLTSLGDGNTPPAAMLRMGLLAQASKWDLLALQGRMFNLKQATIGTAIAGSAAAAGAIVLTAPSIRFSVPAGVTVFPRRFNWAYATAPGTDNEIAVIYTDSNSYTSGGTAATPLNWRPQGRATAVTNCLVAAESAIVEATLGNVRTLYQDMIPLAFAFATSSTQNYRVNVEWDDLIPIVGPASFLVWVSAVTTAATGYFTLDWAEVPTISAVTPI